MDNWVKVRVKDLRADATTYDRDKEFLWWIVNGKYLFPGRSIEDAKTLHNRSVSYNPMLEDYSLQAWKHKYYLVPMNNKLAQVFYAR